MTRNLLDYQSIIQEFIVNIENNYEVLLNVPVKTRGTIIEQRLKSYLQERVDFNIGGSSAQGVDLPAFNTDVKCTSIRQPQSSSPYKSITEKLFGLHYNILLFIYEISEDSFKVLNCAYVPKEMTGCKNATRLLDKLVRDFKSDNISKQIAIKALKGWFFTVDNETASSITSLINSYHKGTISTNSFLSKVESWNIIEPIDLKPDWDSIWNQAVETPPALGVINYSFALQWRLQYSELAAEIYPSNVEKIK